MPAKNSIKTYLAGGYFHLYNRGVEKREIFTEEKDYHVLLSYLKAYLTPKPLEELYQKLASKDTSLFEREESLKLLRLNNFSEEIDLFSYCLIPNHFHFLVKQSSERGIDRFMNSLCTRYTMYFNKKNQRVGKLFQGVYKAVLVKTNEQLLELSRYIHLNPVKEINHKLPNRNLESLILSQPSSYPNYLGKIKQEWVKPEMILSFFSQNFPQLSYQSFTEEKGQSEVPPGISGMIFEE